MGEAKRRRALGFERSAQAEREAREKAIQEQAEADWRRANPEAYREQQRQEQEMRVLLTALGTTTMLPFLPPRSKRMDR